MPPSSRCLPSHGTLRNAQWNPQTRARKHGIRKGDVRKRASAKSGIRKWDPQTWQAPFWHLSREERLSVIPDGIHLQPAQRDLLLDLRHEDR
jgi:hypothetical protein